MKRFILFLAILAGTNAIAYSPEDLKKFETTGKCKGCDLSKAKLTRIIKTLRKQGKSIDLKTANLSDADLRNANLSRIDLGGADLKKANFERANLRAANLEQADLEKANFRRANLGNAYFGSLDLNQKQDFRGSNLYEATFTLTEESKPLYEKYKAQLSCADQLALWLMETVILRVAAIRSQK